ncbi:MAG: ATP-binding protein [Lachnospiraceae bacterium]|jgi:predicted AAA+ superfamily ATPase|nr:ATP-binding protein [Lachnospiraceae bacterium]
MELKRKIYDDLKKWKDTWNGKSAVLIEGARRVGKTFIVKKFAESEYKSYVYIDFAHPSKEIIDLFENDSYELDYFFELLSIYTKKQLYKRNTLIIFDEVQIYPKARQLIKYLVEDGRYDYIETGSLITLKKNVESIVIPSEELHITMYPLDFEEFMWAMGDSVTISFIKKSYDNMKPLGVLHRKIMSVFRQYMLVGGMPQAVEEYIITKDLNKVDLIKRRILTLYREDVPKFAKGYESKVLGIFDNIPAQLSRHEKKFKLSSIKKDARFREYEDSFMWLKEAEIVNLCFNTTDPNIGLSLNMLQNTLKCYMADTGLLFSLALSSKKLIDENVYKNILFDKVGINEGMFFENIVAQMLSTLGDDLFFYSHYDKEVSANRIEIDFLIQRKGKICPIEVKSASYKKHASLDKFINKFGRRLGKKYIIYTKDLKVEDDIIYLPVYMTMFL